MGYLHIENLYRPSAQVILMFKECYALEKIHGTSAHIAFKFVSPTSSMDDTPGQWQVTFFSGGESHERFVSLFNKDELLKKFIDMGLPCDKEVTIYGEAYAGKQQKMTDTYGPNLKFIVFDVSVGTDSWLSVPEAETFAKSLGLEFVHYVKVSTDLKELDAQRDAPSIQAVRNGVSMIVPEGADFNRPSGTTVVPYGNFGDRLVNPKKREGVVLRPLIDLTDRFGNRIISKHKGDDFRETASPRVVDDPSKLKVLEDADAVANEWVTVTRLEHVLDKIPDYGMEKMPIILKAMVEDVTREAKGEIVDNEVVRKAITKKTATMFRDYLKNKLNK